MSSWWERTSRSEGGLLLFSDSYQQIRGKGDQTRWDLLKKAEPWSLLGKEEGVGKSSQIYTNVSGEDKDALEVNPAQRKGKKEVRG